LESGFQALVRSDEQTKWVDEEKGFERRVISPPNGSLCSEVIACHLRPHTTIEYRTPPVPGQEHHLVMIEGELDVTIAGEHYQILKGDCLRYKLFGASCFKTKKSSASYLLFLG
jgi:quercetin dioxygenase-like cupin family protein